MALDWAEKWDEYCRVTDKLAVERATLNYLDRVEKRMFSAVFAVASGNIEERKAAFYSSPEYKEFSEERHEKDKFVGEMLARRDQLQTWFDLWRTEEATRREEARLAR
jgi:hypothetical protein